MNTNLCTRCLTNVKEFGGLCAWCDAEDRGDISELLKKHEDPRLRIDVDIFRFIRGNQGASEYLGVYTLTAKKIKVRAPQHDGCAALPIGYYRYMRVYYCGNFYAVTKKSAWEKKQAGLGTAPWSLTLSARSVCPTCQRRL